MLSFRIIYRFLFVGAILLLLLTPKADAFIVEDRVALSKGLAHYMMGQVYDLLGFTNRAVLEYEKAAQFDDSSFAVRLRLGTDYARLNMLPEAIDQLKFVNKLNPDDLQSRYLLALIYSNQKEYDKAAQEYEIILKKFSAAEPENVEIYGYLGQLYYSQRKYDKAIEQFEKVLQLEPKNPDVLYLLGSLYIEVNQKDKSIDALQKSIEIEPMHDGSLNALGFLYAEENIKLEEAEQLVNRALAISPDNGAYLDSLGWVYFKKGEYDKAVETLKKADSVLKDAVIYDHLGDVYFKMNQADEALKNWELSIGLQPGQEKVIEKINNTKNQHVNNQQGANL